MSSASTRLALRSTLAGVMMATLIPGTGGQTAARQTAFSPARLGDGQTPDFRGIWQVHDTAYVNIEGHPARCQGVRIPISPLGWCQRYERRFKLAEAVKHG